MLLDVWDGMTSSKVGVVKSAILARQERGEDVIGHATTRTILDIGQSI